MSGGIAMEGIPFVMGYQTSKCPEVYVFLYQVRIGIIFLCRGF